MATTSVYLDKRRMKVDGTFPLRIKVTLNGRQGFMINLPISLTADQWNNGKVVRHTSKDIYNRHIREQVHNVEKTLLSMQQQNILGNFTPPELKKIVERFAGMDYDPQRRADLIEYFDKFIKRKSNPSTQCIYEQTLLNIRAFDKRKLCFEDININWLRDFEAYMLKKGLKVNTLFLHFRNIRAVFNSAIDDGTIEQNLYPFRRFKLKHEATEKRALTLEQVRTIRDYKLDECDEYGQQYIDVFMLIFYLIGINIGDLLLLKPNDYQDGVIKYRRRKTGKLYTVKVEPEADALIRKYRGRKYLLRFVEIHGDYHLFSSSMNHFLKKFGPITKGYNGTKIRHPLFPTLTTYAARHSWATIAYNDLEIPKDIIAQALGHGQGTVTDIYIKPQQYKVDNANRMLLDALAGKSFDDDTPW